MISPTFGKFLSDYLDRQLSNVFPDNNRLTTSELTDAVNLSLKRLEVCFDNITIKYYAGEFCNKFNYLNGDHYAMFLYLVSNTIFEKLGNETVASKVFLLNKMLHGIDAFYQIKLPEIFLFIHPLGSVLGNAKYSNYFCVYQHCTIGAKVGENIYPKFSEKTIMYSNTSIIGDCTLGKNVIFGANSSIVSTNVDDNTIVLGAYPNNKFRNLADNSNFSIFRE